MQQVYPPADNFSFNFHPVTDTARSTIHVMDSYANFNITGSMTFTNIDFTGINELAVPNDETATNVTRLLGTIPINKC